MGKCNNPLRCERIRKGKEKQINFVYSLDEKFQRFMKKHKKGESILTFDDHYTKKRKWERLIFEKDIIKALKEGFVIDQQKSYDRRRVTVFSSIKIKPKVYRDIHIILEIQPYNEWQVITVYTPQSQSWKWDETFMERKCFCRIEGDD